MRKNLRFPFIMIISIIIGCILGVIFKGNVKYLKPFGDVFINLMYTIVVPLIFFTITSSIAKMSSIKRLNKILRVSLLVFIGTSIISCIIGLLTIFKIDLVGNSNIILESSTITKTNFLEEIVNAITVNDFSLLFSRSHILPLIIFSVLLGITLVLVDKEKRLTNGFNIISNAFLKMINIIMYYAPIGICAYFASLVGEFGIEIIGSYTKLLLVYVIISIIYYFVIYGFYAYISGGIRGVKSFFKNSFLSVVTSLGTASSLATLPTNMKASSDMGISDDVRDIALPIGSTIHMEGSCLASIFKIFFLLSVFRVDINIGTCLIAVLVAILSGIVMSGIPGGGLIGEMLIVNLYGFPMTAFPIIATIGWLVDAPATMLNAVGDLSSSLLIDRIVNKRA